MKRFYLLSTIARWFSAIVVVLCFVLPAGARVWTPDEVPVPRLHDVRRYVSNPENILSAAAVDSLDRMLGALERDRGVQTLVVVVDRLKGDDPYRFAMTLARKYGVGDRKTRTGLVVLLATGDRSYQFLTGNGLEGTLPDGMIQLIEDRIFVPRLRARRWDAAMLGALSAIDKACRGDRTLAVSDKKRESADGDTPWWIVLFMVGIPAIAFFYGLYLTNKPRRCPHCGKHTLRRSGSEHVQLLRDGRRRPFVRTVWRCTSCGHTQDELREEHDEAGGGAGLLVAGALLNGLLRGGRSSGGWGGSSGGSYGGGSFGGGGSGGRF